uniref:Uncharacterized protein n=1 Tax=Aegilops tauschii subsp. strangulata TaxID=200361 RepID=A0A452ZUF7_AEGTS
MFSASSHLQAPRFNCFSVVCVQPKPGADGSYPVDRAAAVSGDKLLRDVMVENKIELYAAYV